MKKILISLLCVALCSASCTNNAKEEQLDTPEKIDSLSVAIGQLLAVECYMSNLSDYSDQIGKAVDDVFNGQINKVHEAYAYVDAVDIASKSYSQLNQQLNPEVIKQTAKDVIARSKDSLSREQLDLMQKDANEYVMSYFDTLFGRETKLFLSDVDKMEGIQKTDNGIRYKIIKPGKGKIASNDQVDVNYTLYDYNGKIIDSNESTGAPFHVALPGGVVPGFAQAIQLVGEGGKLRAWIPAELGYGDQGSSSVILPGQVLVFTIEVVKKY